MSIKTTRFSGADWATETRYIMLIGAGGIGSWTALNLARIGHEIHIIDPDIVDETNVNGGQLFIQSDVGVEKSYAASNICRLLGASNPIYTYYESYSKEESGTLPIMITGVDNMAARKEAFEAWCDKLSESCSDGPTEPSVTLDFLFIDGRLTMEMYEIFCIQGNNEEQIREYREKHLFSDEEADELGCTTKQSTFAAMGIASMITATLCNWLTNRKLGEDLRPIPFYQRMFLPTLGYATKEVEQIELTV